MPNSCHPSKFVPMLCHIFLYRTCSQTVDDKLKVQNKNGNDAKSVPSLQIFDSTCWMRRVKCGPISTSSPNCSPSQRTPTMSSSTGSASTLSSEVQMINMSLCSCV